MELVLEPYSLEIVAMSDASYACHEDGRSQSGALICIGGCTVWARSSKQTLVTKSSAEAELIALNSVVEQVVFMRHIMEEIGYKLDTTTTYVDNSAAVIMSRRGELGTRRTRHFVVRHYWVWDQIQQGVVRVKHLGAEGMVADGLTKILTGKAQATFTDLILGGNTVPPDGVLDQVGTTKRRVTWKRRLTTSEPATYAESVTTGDDEGAE